MRRSTNQIWVCAVVFASLFVLWRLLSYANSPSSWHDRDEKKLEFPAPDELDKIIVEKPQEVTEFTSYLEGKLHSVGKPFDKVALQKIHEWKLDDTSAVDEKEINPSDVVFVTYASSNHFTEAKAAIQDLRTVHPLNQIIFYDIGLSKGDVDELSKVCKLEVRKFKFSAYPSFVSSLHGYNFKPIIAAEVYATGVNAFWLMDTSVQIRANVTDVYQRVNIGQFEPYLIGESTGTSIFSVTDPKMYKILPIDAELARSTGMRGATALIKQSAFSREVLKWYALCALTKECMSPSGSQLSCRFAKDDRMKAYAKCHRYDQSTVNIVLASLRERKADWKVVRARSYAVFESNVIINRGNTLNSPLSLACKN